MLKYELMQATPPILPLHDTHREVWLKVSASQVVDLQDAICAMSLEDRKWLAERVTHRSAAGVMVPECCSWFPERPDSTHDDEPHLNGVDQGLPFVDWWIFPVRKAFEEVA